jgi:hypothetical protein
MKSALNRRKFIILVSHATLLSCGVAQATSDGNQTSGEAVGLDEPARVSATVEPTITVVPTKTMIPTPLPTAVPLVSKGRVKSIHSSTTSNTKSFGNVVAILENGEVVSWDAGYSSNSLVSEIALPQLLTAVTDEKYAVGIDINNKLVGWGESINGSLDLPTGDEKFIKLSTCGGCVMAVTEAGKVIAWGGTEIDLLDVPAGLQECTLINVSENYALAYDKQGKLWHWGTSELITGTPSSIEALSSISSSVVHAVAVTEDGALYSWGKKPDSCEKNVPSILNLSSPITQAVSREFVTYVLDAEGDLALYGGIFDIVGILSKNGVDGLCGVLPYNPNGIIQELNTRIVQITSSTMVLTEKGSILSWPAEYTENAEPFATNCENVWGSFPLVYFQKTSGVKGVHNYTFDTTVPYTGFPDKIVDMVRHKSEYSYAGFSYAILTVDNILKLYNPEGQIGEGIPEVNSIAYQKNLDIGSAVVFYVDTNNMIQIWSDEPVAGRMSKVPNVKEKVAKIKANNFAALAMDVNGQVYAWGQKEFLQFELSDVVDIAQSTGVFSALKKSGELLCWGYVDEKTFVNLTYPQTRAAKAVTNSNDWVAILLESGEVVIHYFTLPTRASFYVRGLPEVKLIKAIDENLFVITENNDLISLKLDTRPARASCVLECLID